MATRGKKAKIDLAELEKLSAMQATNEEIAAFFGLSCRTIQRRLKSNRFAEIVERGRAKGRLSLRRQQLKLVEGGSAPMAIFLGKNLLGQRDTFEFAATAQVQVVVPIQIATIQQSAGEIIDVTEISPEDCTIELGVPRRELLGS
jgi:hypothetical protein